jgi:hypothetical protein
MKAVPIVAFLRNTTERLKKAGEVVADKIPFINKMSKERRDDKEKHNISRVRSSVRRGYTVVETCVNSVLSSLMD